MQAMINLLELLTAIMSKPFRKYLKNFMTKAIYIKADTKAGTALHANHSGQILS